MYKKIEKLAWKIADYLTMNNLHVDVCIYFNNKRLISKYEEDYRFIQQDNCNPFDYFDYANPKHILSMSFEGSLYHLLNGYTISNKVLKGFNALFEEYGLCYELGDAWNLTAFPLNDNYEDYEYTNYDVQEVIFLNINNKNVDPVFALIMKEWYNASHKIGDLGSCVIGAGIEFNYSGNKYFMSNCSPYQGSLSWEKTIDIPKRMLNEIGATDIRYNPGHMD